MARELEKLMADVEEGVKQIKSMSASLDSGDLGSLSTLLQRIIEFSAELAKMIDDCEILQKEFQIKKAVSLLIDSGYEFQSIEIDGVRYDIDKDEVLIYQPEDDIRR